MIAFEIQEVKNNIMLDSVAIGKPFLLKELLLSNEMILANSTIIPFRERYNLRPDILAYEHYGIVNYYPVILFANKISSMYQFTKENLNNECVIPNLEFIKKYII